MTHILIIEDEEKLALVLKKYVEAEGYSSKILEEGTNAVEVVQDTKPDLILLDIMLPGKNGIDICKEVRQFSQVPIIMVTAKVEEIDMLIGLELGADDYINKPFSPREVIARVKALIRRSQASLQEQVNDQDLILDANTYTASLKGIDLNLTPVEFRILISLYGPPAQVLNRDQLIDKMYNDHRAVSDRTVDSHVANLRKKLKAVRPESEFIQPIYGVGYRFIG